MKTLLKLTIAAGAGALGMKLYMNNKSSCKAFVQKTKEKVQTLLNKKEEEVKTEEQEKTEEK